MFWILILILCITLAYLLFIKPHNYWTEKGVKQTRPVPIFGDNWGTLCRTESFAESIQYVYNQNPDTRYSGMYQLLSPVLVLRDPDLIKQLTVKEFDHFLNHRSLIPNDADPLLGRNLAALKDQQWRDMRSTLSPVFTSSKMRQMFVLITEIAEQFVQHFLKKNEEIVTIEMRDTFTRYTNDVIASTACGIKCDSLEERNNEFYLIGKEASDFTEFWKSVKFFGYFLFPKFCQLLNVKLFSKEVTDFFVNLIQQNIKQREEHGIVRPDLIQLLLDARKNGFKHEDTTNDQRNEGFATVEESDIIKSIINNKKEITDLDITSQAFTFFFAGFDTVSTAMCFMGYELGANSDIQERLRQEVDEIADECDDKLTYKALMKMKYMDMIISETLRKWPNTIITERVCTKPFTIKAATPEEKPVHLNIGDSILLPIFGIHRDPRYYPDPDRFDPERFNDENKHKINPYTYIPFGSGPRNCIGSRFALLETKTLFFYILRNFEIVPIKKTEIPLKISKKSFNLTAENGFWFGLKRRVT